MNLYLKMLFLLLSLVSGFTFESMAQVPTVHFTEDMAIDYVVSPEEATVYELPPVDVVPYQEEDIELDAGNNPYRFGAPVQVEINIIELAEPVIIEEQRVWKMKLFSEGAKSLNVVFENLILPESAELYIYGETGREVQGPIVQSMVPDNRRLGSTVLGGASIIVEYVQPLSAEEDPNLNISKVVHGYREFWGSDGDYGTSRNCNNDVRCAIGDDWCVEQRSVTRLLINDNAFCTGGAINNDASNLDDAFILTANHCLSGNLNNWQFEFHYKNPTCGATSYSGTTWGFTGATLRANWADTDFALVELNNYNPNNNIHRLAGIHFAGWSRVAGAATEATGIHHPQGDVMKISRDNNGTVVANWPGTIANSHWRADFNSGTVEHGSSGSPLFDQNHRIVGQLHGNLNYFSGANYCNIPNGWYGRLNVSWNGGGTPATRLSNWLGAAAGNTVDAFCAPIIYHNEQITGNAGLHTATHDMELEGNVNGYPVLPSWFPPIFPVNNQAFVAFSGSTASYQAGESVVIRPGVHLDNGSSIHVYIDPLNCNDGLDYHYSDKGDVIEESIDQKVKAGEVTSTIEADIYDRLLKVFPNPARDICYVSLQGVEHARPLSIRLVNFQGQQVLQQQVEQAEGNIPVQIDKLPSGIYSVIVELEDGSQLMERLIHNR